MRTHTIRWACLLVVLLGGAPDLPAQSSVQYVYDNAGRLIAVIDASGDSAVYHYDAAGNVLSIDRQAASTVSIITFSPPAGAVGTTVTIVGTGFSSTPSQNTVTFNGTAAAVTSASSTQLVASVPAGATTGGISVTAPNGSATSADSFTVGAVVGAPTISSFTPSIGGSGTSVAVSGTNFNTTATSNRVLFNDLGGTAISSASATSLGISVPAIATSGRLTVATPAGIATSTSDFFVPPSPYLASDVASTGRGALGASSSVPVGTANKVGLLLLDGVLGHRLSVKIVPGPLSTVTIYKPNGSVFGSVSVGAVTTLFEPQTMPANATYTILVDPTGTATGTTTLTPYDVPDDITGTITPGGSGVTPNMGTPGQNAVYAVATPTNPRVSLKLGGGPTGIAYVRNADGTTLKTGSMSAVATFVEPWTFASGQSIKADPTGANTGTVTLTAYDVPPDTTGTLTVGGGSVGVTLSGPGQNGSLTFSGSASQQVTVHVTSNTMSAVTVKLLSTTGSTLASNTSLFSSFNLSTVTLPTTGTYTVTVDPLNWNIGSMNVSVSTP